MQSVPARISVSRDALHHCDMVCGEWYVVLSLQHLVVNGRGCHTVLGKCFGYVSLLLGVDGLFAIFEMVVKSLAKVFN